MALTKTKLKEILSKAEANSEKISEAVEEIMSGHTASIDALREERDNFKTEAEKVTTLQKELEDAKKAMENGDKSPYKVKFENLNAEYNQLQKEFEDYKAEITSKESLSKKSEAYKALLKEVGISEKRLDSVLKVSPLDKIELDDEGKLKNVDELKKSIQSEWADFIVTTGKEGARTSNPPSNNGGDNRGASLASQIAADYYKTHYGTNIKED